MMAKNESDDHTEKISSSGTTMKNRNTRASIAVKLCSIRNMMLDGATNTTIMATLSIPQRTFYRYMNKIYQEDRVELAKKNRETLATHILFLRERLMQSVKNCQNMALDPAISAKERIEAERLKIDASVAIARLEVEGTTITQVSPYAFDEHNNNDPDLSNKLPHLGNMLEGDNA